MTDIVERLRQGVDIDYATGSFGDTEKVMNEAADEIERLRDQLAEERANTVEQIKILGLKLYDAHNDRRS